MRKKKANLMRDIKLVASKENFLGLAIDRTKTICTCIAVDINEYGEMMWECTLKETGEVILRKSPVTVELHRLPATKEAFENERKKTDVGY